MLHLALLETYSTTAQNNVNSMVLPQLLLVLYINGGYFLDHPRTTKCNTLLKPKFVIFIFIVHNFIHHTINRLLRPKLTVLPVPKWKKILSLNKFWQIGYCKINLSPAYNFSLSILFYLSKHQFLYIYRKKLADFRNFLTIFEIFFYIQVIRKLICIILFPSKKMQLNYFLAKIFTIHNNFHLCSSQQQLSTVEHS